MNKEFTNFKDSDSLVEVFDRYTIADQVFNVKTEIKKNKYSRVYFNNILVAQSPSATYGTMKALLYDARHMAEAVINKSANLNTYQSFAITFTNDDGNFTLVFRKGDFVYSYIEDDDIFYRNYQADAVGFLRAKFEAEIELQKRKENVGPEKS
ncbi:MAG: hypothetical protein IJS68_03935 [Clostridia bacterium]|nr:hypothetical protein [Clostridia bacterium]